MSIEHTIFIQPPDENVRVWRYMSFTKLISLLESQCLFFSRADKLGDPFEGSLPIFNIFLRNGSIAMFPPSKRAKNSKVKEDESNIMKLIRKHVAVNCWHMNNEESAAMWKLYMKGNEGTAIQSTYKKLKDSISDAKQIYLGMVKYIDYLRDQIETNIMLSPFMYKRKSYEHEREVRALITDLQVDNMWKNDLFKETIQEGRKIQVDMGVLIETIYVAPYSPVWFEELVRSVVKKYGFNFKIKHSRLDESPLF